MATMPLPDLFVHVYVLIDEAVASGSVAHPPRPDPAPACTDAELLTTAVVRNLLGRPSEAGFVAEVRRDWGHYSRACRPSASRRPRGPTLLKHSLGD